ncbi:polysaccharide biosynthesis/export family protein [Flavobacteriaceae bacterium]|nr:polysaccharide biosynthesis/export family protein [Flavobacteriaceae bacterium]
MIKRHYFKIILIIFLSSCASKKDVYYFQDVGNSVVDQSFEFLNIQLGDILDIKIKALEPESVSIFERQPSTGIQPQQVQNRVIDGYLVANDGTITLPIIGTIYAANKSTQTLALELEKALDNYIIDPSVNVRILNFKFSVLGEVKTPGTFTVMEEMISLPQAIGLAGDLTISGDRKNMLLIRNVNGLKQKHDIDLTKSDLLQSPFYYLKQNDIIYVKPNNVRVKSSGFIGDVRTITSIMSLAVSLFIVITR